MKAYDLTNQKFGKLTALYKCNYKKGNKYPWHCICECGKEVDVRTQDLIAGKTKSCGCLQKEIASKIGSKTGKITSQLRIQDLTNQKFGRLTVLKLERDLNGKIKWLCQCECGNFIKVNPNDLKSGNTKSCGCLKSIGQYTIANLLRLNNISFVSEKEFKDFYYEKSSGKPRFDFFIEDKYIIEYDGIQHFKEVDFFKTDTLLDRQIKDNQKNEWCKKNNIPIIRIPYYHLKKIKIEDLLLETSEFIIK